MYFVLSDRYFEQENQIHVKLMVCQHKFRRQEVVKGLFVVPYTPHANAFELFTLLQAVNPQRVCPIIKRTYADDRMSTIPTDLLNDDCEIVDDDDIPEDMEIVPENSQSSFLKRTQDSEDLDELFSEEISEPDLCTRSDDDEDELRYGCILLKTHENFIEFPINFERFLFQ